MLNDVPDGWKPTTVGQVASLNDDSLSSKTSKDYEFSYVSIDNVSTGSINGWASQTFAQAPSRARRIVKQGDILLSTVRPYLKAFARVNEKYEDLVVSTGFAVLRAGADINENFLYQLIFSESFIEHLKGLMTGSNYPAVKPADIASFKFVLPPLNEQHRIAEILSSVDASIQATQAVIEQAERVKHGLMERLLTGGLGSEAIERGEVPEGWCLHAPISNYIKNKTQKWNGYEVLPYIGLEHIEKGSGRLLGFGESGDITSSKNVFEEGDVLFGKLRPNLRKYWRANKRGICSTDILILRSQKEMLNEYLFIIVQSELFLAFAENDAAGTKMPRTSWKRLETIELPLPPLKEQKRIAEIILSFDELIGQQMLIAEKQTRTKRGLMDDLLTGKVRTV